MNGETKSIEGLIAELEDMVEKAPKAPLRAGKCMVDIATVEEIIEDMRENFPQEIRKAKGITKERETILDEANKTADEIIRKAQERARQMVDQEEILKQARAKAMETDTKSRDNARQVKAAAIKYADDVLLNTESALNQGLEVIRQSRKSLRAVVQQEVANKSGKSKNSESDSE